MLKLVFMLLGLFKLGKLGGTGITMILSLGAYALLFGWRYAAGFIALLFLHEMGHYLAARQKGLAVGAPTFIPFVGAWIDLKEQADECGDRGLCGPCRSVCRHIGGGGLLFPGA